MFLLKLLGKKNTFLFGQDNTGKYVARARNWDIYWSCLHTLQLFFWPVDDLTSYRRAEFSQGRPWPGTWKRRCKEPLPVSTWGRRRPDILLNPAEVSGPLLLSELFRNTYRLLFMVTECARGNRPAGCVRGKTNGFAKPNTSFSQRDRQCQRSLWPQPRAQDCPRAWTFKWNVFIDWASGARTWFTVRPHPLTSMGLTPSGYWCS